MATLKSTYEESRIHDDWESVYRNSSVQDRFNDRVLADALEVLSVPAGARFLDAGCGVGDHSARLVRLGLQGVGIDISEKIIERARTGPYASANVDFRTGSLDALPFESGTFDLVHCKGVLMHIPNWTQALAELCRVTRPGGALVILENNSRSLEMKMVRLLRKFRRSASDIRETEGGTEAWSVESGQPFVVRVANHDAFERELRKNGCAVVKKRATSLIGAARVPSSVRDYLRRLNVMGYNLHLPTSIGMGTVFMIRKAV